jgi:hypothetical protein
MEELFRWGCEKRRLSEWVRLSDWCYRRLARLETKTDHIGVFKAFEREGCKVWECTHFAFDFGYCLAHGSRLHCFAEKPASVDLSEIWSDKDTPVFLLEAEDLEPEAYLTNVKASQFGTFRSFS